jgi:hypothetical protein
MRTAVPVTLVALLASIASADCVPPNCVAGGGPGPKSTDCFVAWSGIPGMTVTCTDGDACDSDGKADGLCTIPVQACINVPGLGSCTPGGLSAAPSVTPASQPAAQMLENELTTLNLTAEGCTAPGLPVPLGVKLAGIKPGKARMTVTATSGGKRDRDKLRLTCMPSATAPSFAQDVQPILTAKCAIPACHSGPQPSGGQNLEAGRAYADDVDVHATTGPRVRVKRGSIRASEVAHRILGQALPPGGAIMPQGCPGFPPAGGCLTPAEIFTILSWIQNGALNN